MHKNVCVKNITCVLMCIEIGLTGGIRERCDSLPSRARTTSEGAHQHLPHPPRSHLAPSYSRPHSMYNRGISYSPPVASSPVRLVFFTIIFIVLN